MVYYIHRQVHHIQIQVNKKDLLNFKKVLTKVNEIDILNITKEIRHNKPIDNHTQSIAYHK